MQLEWVPGESAVAAAEHREATEASEFAVKVDAVDGEARLKSLALALGTCPSLRFLTTCADCALTVEGGAEALDQPPGAF
jgi:hypothetical protein